ncbi:MAG: C4-dicarboxylate ABC transporter permease [Geminicoccus sp.]|nr:C4-dicarboxylate ABC transporter permease [Geminicoccus sp.]
MRDWQPILGLPLWAWLFVLPSAFALVCLWFGPLMERLLTPVWRILDAVYVASGALAAVFMVSILLLIVAQMASRWMGLTFPGGTEFAGYAMAGTSFFALAYALTRGAHIRVSVFLNLTSFSRLWLDAFAMLIAAITATYFARYAIKTNFVSEMLNDRTQGLDQVPTHVLTLVSMFGTWPWNWVELWSGSSAQMVYTPVWLPQIVMSLGTVLLAVAVWDNLFRLLATRKSAIVQEAVE